MTAAQQEAPKKAGRMVWPRWVAPLIAAATAIAVASLGGALTNLGPWYEGLEKPWWQPPGFAFPLMWTLIFTLTAISAVLAWRSAHSAPQRRALLLLLSLNGVLNVAWSGLFFTLQRPDLALIEAAALWLSVVSLIVYIWPIRKLAALLLTPYAVWVAIAIALNWEILRLNPL